MFRDSLMICKEMGIELSEDLQSLQEHILLVSSYKQCEILRIKLSKPNTPLPSQLKEGSLVSYFVDIVREAKSIIEVKELAQASLLLSTQDFSTLLAYLVTFLFSSRI